MIIYIYQVGKADMIMDEMKDVNENGVSSDIGVSEEKAPETAKKSSLTKKDIKTLIITGSVLVVLFWAYIIAYVVIVISAINSSPIYDDINDFTKVEMNNVIGGEKYRGGWYDPPEFFNEDRVDVGVLEYTESYGMECTGYGGEAWLIAYTFSDSGVADTYYARVRSEEPESAYIQETSWKEVTRENGQPETTWHYMVKCKNKVVHMASDNEKLLGEFIDEVREALN